MNLLPDNGRKQATDELLHAEAGLSRAKEEYRRLQQEVCLISPPFNFNHWRVFINLFLACYVSRKDQGFEFGK